MSTKIDLSKPLMPKATATWLIDNTKLTFAQIANFCSLLEFEVESIANKPTIVGKNPISEGLLTLEEIHRCEENVTAQLKSSKRKDIPAPRTRSKGPRYTPVAKRGDKPDGIAYILKHHSEISDAQITKLVGTTKNTIEKIRDKSHVNISNIRPRHPAELGLCTYEELDLASRKGFKAMGKDPDTINQNVMINQETSKANESEDTPLQPTQKSGFDFSNFMGTPENSSQSTENPFGNDTSSYGQNDDILRPEDVFGPDDK